MRLAVILVFISVVCGVVYFVFSHPSLEQLERLERELGVLQAQNEELADKNEDLEHQIRALRDDPRLMERRARDSVGLARPDELVFQFEEPAPEQTMQVRLRVSPQELELAGRPVALQELEHSLASLHAQMPHTRLRVVVDDDVGPIERQRVMDIVEQSPLGPGQWNDEG